MGTKLFKVRKITLEQCLNERYYNIIMLTLNRFFYARLASENTIISLDYA